MYMLKVKDILSIELPTECKSYLEERMTVWKDIFRVLKIGMLSVTLTLKLVLNSAALTDTVLETNVTVEKTMLALLVMYTAQGTTMP